MARKQMAKTFMEKVLGTEDEPETLTESDLDGIELDEEQAVKGLETGLNTAIKKGVQKGAEESVTPTVQKVAKQVLDQVIGGKNTSPLDDLLEKEKKMTEVEMLRAMKDKIAPKTQSDKSESELLNTILLLKQQGFSTDEILKYIRLIRGGSDPLMIMELLNTSKQPNSANYAPQTDNSIIALLPLLMNMNQQQHQPQPQPQSNGISEVMAVFMQTMSQMQQQTMLLMQQMQQQSREASERMMQFMAQAQEAKQENLIRSIQPYLSQKDPDEELVESVERFKKLKEIFAPNTEKYQMPVNRDLLEHEQMMAQIKHQQEMDRLKMERELKEKEQSEKLLEKVTEIAEKGLTALKAKERTENGDGKAEDFARQMARLRAMQQDQPPAEQEPVQTNNPLFGVVE
jgi:hypothetical protein